jgi:purine-nucleoside phosphorylase
MMKLDTEIEDIKAFLLKNGFPEKVGAVVILGSGLGSFAENIQNPIKISYHDIPNFPATSVQGHSGELVTGVVGGENVITFSGRFHFYEGHSISKTVLPVHLAKVFDADKLIISNAAGAINTSFKIGDLMVIDDLIRPFHSTSSGPSQIFRYNLYPYAEKVRKIAAKIGLDIQKGSYVYVKGPNYETKAEIRAFRVLGGDVVGMSTSPELIEASRLNVPAVAISMVTNMAAGVQKGKLDHSEVKEAAESRKDDFARLVTELIIKL